MTLIYTHETITMFTIMNTSIIPRVFLHALCNLSLALPLPRQPLICSLPLDPSFPEFYINGIIWYALCIVCLLSLSVLILGFIHVGAHINSPCLLLTGRTLLHGETTILFTHSAVARHLDCFQFEAVTHTVSCVQIFVQTFALISLGEIPRNEMARS